MWIFLLDEFSFETKTFDVYKDRPLGRGTKILFVHKLKFVLVFKQEEINFSLVENPRTHARNILIYYSLGFHLKIIFNN